MLESMALLAFVWLIMDRHQTRTRQYVGDVLVLRGVKASTRQGAGQRRGDNTAKAKE